MCDDCLDDCCCDTCSCCSCVPQSHRWIIIPLSFIIGFGIFLTIVLVPLSIQTVKFDEVAIEFDKVSRAYGGVLREGIHDIGPAGSLLIFKRTQRQGVIDKMSTLTADGVYVYVTVDVLYTINSKNDDDIRSILELYYDQEGHDLYINAMAETVVRDVVSNFTARSFFLQRQEVQTQMFDLLKVRFANGTALAEVDTVQLSNVDFISEVADSLQASTIVQQDIDNAIAERPTLINASMNSKVLASLEADLLLLKAERAVSIRQVQATAAQLATRASLRIRTDTFSNISASLTKGSDFFVYEYLRYLLLRLNSGRTIVGLDGTS